MPQPHATPATPDRRFDTLFQASEVEIDGLQMRVSSSVKPVEFIGGLFVNRSDRTLSENIAACEINQSPADVAVIYDLTRPMSDRITCSTRHSVTHEMIEVVAEYASRVTIDGDVLSFTSSWTTDEHDRGTWAGAGAVRWLTKGSSRIVLRITQSGCDVLDYHGELEEDTTNPGTPEPPLVDTSVTEKTPATTCALLHN